MPVVQSTDLNEDTNGVPTSGEYADRGDGTSKWLHWFRKADGGDATIGAKADATVLAAALPASASVIALLKGILSSVGGAAGGKAEDSVAASGDLGSVVLAVRRDTAASSSATDGDYVTLNTDSTGRLRTVADTTEVVTNPTNATTTALDDAIVVKASAGKLWGITGYSTAAQFVQVHNTTTVVADTAVPVVVFPVEANKPFSIDFGAKARAFSTGIMVCNSSTGPTKTVGGNTCWFDVQYE